MNTLSVLVRSFICCALFLAPGLFAQEASRAGIPNLKTFQTYIDRDADPSTGLDVLLNDGTTTAPGVEILLTVTVQAGPSPMVVMVEAQDWDGNAGFNSPYFTDASGWPVGTNNGTSASDVVEAFMPLDRLGVTQNINLFVQSGDPASAFDIVDPTPFMFGVPIPTMGEWMLIFYMGLLLLAALWFLRHQKRSKSKGLLALFAASLLFGATCNILLDGQIGDWPDPALANDPVNDAADDAVDILAFFTCYDHQHLFVRFDVEELENQPPVPDDQMVTLLEDTPTVISLTATDPNGNQLLFSIDSGPANGSTGAVTTTGLDSADVTYTPNADFNGVDSFTFLVDDQNGGTAIGTVDLTIDAVNDVPSFTAGAQVSVSKDTGPQVINGWATNISAGPPNESGQSLTFSVNVTSNPGVFAVAPTIDVAGNLSFTPDADNNGTATLEIQLMDDGGTANGGVDISPIQMADIVIGPVNDAPTFTAGSDQTDLEDDGAITVNGWATAMSPGPPDEAGQMLTFIANLTSDPGSLFSVPPAIDATTGDLSYTLAADAFGVATVEVTLMDDGGTANGGVDTSPPHILTITVDPINDAPSFANSGNVNVFKGGSTETIPAWASALSPGPANESGQSFTGFTVVVTNDPDSVLGNTPTVDTATGDLMFDTTADNNGTATISVTLMDDGGTANGGVDTSVAAVIDIMVGAVNDAPSFTAGMDQTHNEDDGAINVMAWATAISAGPPDESGQMLTFIANITSDPDSLFSVPPAIDATTGNLTYTLADDANGVATVDITLMDDGGTANGGVDTSPPQTLTITVNPVNDAPSFANSGDVNIFKAGTMDTISGWASMLSTGPANESSQGFIGFTVMVTSDPNNMIVGTPTVDVMTGDLHIERAPEINGTAIFSITLQDDGGTANGGVDTSAPTVINVTVGPVNDAPSFTAGADQTHNEDDGAINVMAWATSISPGPPNESGQMLTFNAMVTSNPGNIFSVPPAVDETTGNLTYTLAADAFGVATVDITLMDDGGTANGGVDTSPPHTLTITVNEVNDVPSFANTGNINVFKGGGTETVPAWANSISAGPANESGQVLTFNVAVTNDPNSVLGSTPTVDPATGNLVFDTTADNNGTATISVTLMDDGGTANGGIDTSPAAMIDIVVGSVNDAPSFTAGANQTHNEDDGAINVMAWATAISAGPPDEAGQNLTFNAMVTSDPGNIFSVAPAIDSTTGNLTYTLAANAFGVAMVDITLMDDGGTANGGVDTSAPQTLTITVNSVNDEPTFANAGNVNVFKGGGTETIPAWATSISAGPANESSQVLTFNVAVTNDPNGVLGGTPMVDPTTGNLVFDTTADNNGTASISVTLMDDGGTANGGVDTSSTIVLDIIVGSVNDAPSFTAGANQTHNEDDGAINVMAWATAISAGPPDEVGQILTFNAMVTSDPGGIFSVPPAVNAMTGALTYTLAADAFGVATVDITLMDDGGTANGGVDTSTTHTLTVTVNAVNDAPSFANGGDITAIADGATNNTAAWATMFSTGPTNESTQSLTGFNVMVTSDPSGVLGNTPSVDVGTGNLSFDTVIGNVGTATISVTLMDDGGTANGGMDTSAAAVIMITVNPPNSPPVANDDSFDAAVHTLLEVGSSTAAPGHEIAGSVLTSGTPDSDPDAGTTLIVTGTSGLTPGAVLNMNADGTFTLLPPSNTTTGTVTFDYTISDQHPTFPMTDTGTVTITLHDPIWYVKNDHPGPSQGTSENPFQTLAEAEAAAGPNHKIFVFTGDGTVTGHNAGITLQDGQSLLGERSDLVLNINGSMSTVVTGSGVSTIGPRLGNAGGDVVTLGDNNTVRGLILLPTASAGIIGFEVVPMKTDRGKHNPRIQKYLDRVTPRKRAGGTSVIDEVLITPSGMSDGLCFLGQSGNLTVTNTDITGLPGNTGVGLILDSCTAAFTFDNLDISSLGTGLFLTANTTPGGITFNNTNLFDCSDVAVNISNEATGITLAATSTVNQTTGGRGVRVAGTGSTINFNGPITVDNLTGATADAVSVLGFGSNPTVNFGAVTLNAVGGRFAVLLETLGATSDINFNGILDINGAESDAFRMQDIEGAVDITQATSDIASSKANGVLILGGAPTFTCNATITNNIFGVTLLNVTGGTTNFNGTLTHGTSIHPLFVNNGLDFDGSAGTHTFERLNIGTMATPSPDQAIEITSCTGTFNFENFDIYAVRDGLSITAGNPTVNTMTTGTVGNITSTTVRGILNFAGTMNGRFTNITVGSMGAPASGPGLLILGGGGGNLTFEDIDIHVNSGAFGGIEINAHDVTFDPASDINVSVNGFRGLILQNGAYTGQIDSITKTGTNNGVRIVNQTGTLELGKVDVNTPGGIGFELTNAGTITVTDPTSSISTTNNVPIIINAATIGPGNISFANVTGNTTGGGAAVTINNLSGNTLQISDLQIDNSALNPRHGMNISNTSATIQVDSGSIMVNAWPGISIATSSGNFNFNDLAIQGTNQQGFIMTGGGTVQFTGTNTVAMTTGTAVQIENATIGAANATFESINTNGATNGIRLDNTGAVGGLIVTGTGANDSGGNIQNSTADAIFLNNTASFSLTDMQVNSSTTSHINATGVNGLSLDGVDFATSGFHGINGSGITGLNMVDCTLDQSGNAANEHGIQIINLLGSSNITSTDFTSSATIHAFINNTSASVAAPAAPTDILTFDDCSFSMPVVGTFGDNLSVEAGNTSNLRLILDDAVGQNTFVGGQDGVQAVTSTGGTLDVIIDNIDVQTTTGTGTNIGGFNASNLTYQVSNIDTLNTNSIGINVTSIGGAIMSGIIDTNVINGSATGVGIQTVVEGNGSNTITINNNTVTNIDFDHGIRVIARAGSGTINATITGNNIDISGGTAPLEGIGIEAGATNTDTNTICLNLSGNTSVSNGIEGYFLRRRDMATFNLQGIAQMNPTNPQVVTWVNATNTGTVFISGMGFTQAPANCPTP